MGLGTVTLLEVYQVPSGKRIAFCLPSGEFIVVTDTCAPEFSANDAADLYGCNLFQFLLLRDAERLDDFLRAQQQYGMNGGSGLVVDQSQQQRLIVRLSRNPSTQLWIQLSNTPLTLRMMRCIDTIHSLSHPLGLFADSSSFVLSEDEISSMVRNPITSNESPQASEGASQAFEVLPTDDDELTFLEFENCCLSPTSCTFVEPLELKHRKSGLGIPPSGLEEAESDEIDQDLRASLSNLAFEADWSNETLQDDAGYGLFTMEPTTPTSSNTNSMATTKPGFRAELVT